MIHNTRISSIDAARGVGILLVILGHSIQYSRPDMDASVLFRYIYAFHMPLFFAISGYCGRKSALRMVNMRVSDFYKRVYRDFWALMVPYYIWTLLVLLADPYGFIGNLSASFVIRFLFGNIEIFWFLPCLFYCRIASNFDFFILQRFRWEKQLIAIIIIIITILILDCAGLCDIFYALFYFTGYYLLSVSGTLEARGGNKDYILFCGVVSAFLIIAYYFRRNTYPSFFDGIIHSPFWLLQFGRVYRIVTATIGIITCLSAVTILCKEKHVHSILIYLGKHTIELYTVSTAAYLLLASLCSYNAQLIPIPFPLLFVVILCISLLLTWSISKRVYLSRLLFGK